MTTPSLPKLDRFSIHFTIYLSPSDLPTFYSHFEPAFKSSTTEKECLYMEVFEDPEELGKVTWIENWEGTPEWFLTVRSFFPLFLPFPLVNRVMMV